jgi:hypothetical protein
LLRYQKMSAVLITAYFFASDYMFYSLVGF